MFGRVSPGSWKLRGQSAVARRTAVLGMAIALTLGSGPLASALGAAPQDDVSGVDLEVTLLRTWAPEDLTVVDGLANVPLAMLAGGTTGAYRFELTVFDATDTQLYRDSWERQLSRQAAAYVESGTSYLLEPFRFGVRPGEYEVEVRAYPTDAPDLGERVRLPLEAFDGRPVMSDLFLATRVEPITEGAGGGSWSVTHGGFGIAAAAQMSVLPAEPDLYYYLELYGQDDETMRVSVSAEVVSGDRVVYRTPDADVEVGVGGVPFTGHISLAGLPPGEYQLAMSFGEVDGARRTAPFRMLDPVRAVAAGTAGGSYEAEYFGALSDTELEATFGGVAVLITDTERVTFEALPPDAKRRYLTEFFQRQDPDPTIPGNRFLDEYVERVGTIRARYDETVGTGERLPWFTDRGRIYLKYGEPQDRIVNYNPVDISSQAAVATSGAFAGEPPYEIWQYQTTSFVYLFISDDRFGSWRLIYSSDPDVASLADWYDRAGPSALSDLQSNFGIKPRFGIN